MKISLAQGLGEGRAGEARSRTRAVQDGKNLKYEVLILQDERDQRIEDLLENKTATGDLVEHPGRKGSQEGSGADPGGAQQAAPFRHPEA